MGSQNDHETWAKARRVDDTITQTRVSQSRALIYEKHYAVTASKVEDILYPTSQVPTRVSLPSSRTGNHGLMQNSGSSLPLECIF